MTPVYSTLYRIYRITSWMRFRAIRRFTPAGWLVLAALCAAAMTGLDTENTVSYQAFTPLAGLLILACLCSFFFNGHFAANRILPKFGTVGKSLSYKIQVRNLSAREQNGLVLQENLADPRPTFKEWKAMQLADERRLRSLRFSRRTAQPVQRAVTTDAPVPAARPNEVVDVQGELLPMRRGVLRFDGISLTRPDPFGLCRAFRRIPAPQSILVLPKRYPLPPLPMPGTMKYQEGGVALASNVGRSEEFVALRDYRRGDPLRHIHWRSWARIGKPIVKEFEDEFFVRHALILDTFTDEPDSDIFEEAVSLAASFACTVQTQESLLDLLFVGPEAFCFTAGRGLAHTDQMLEILASVQPCADQSIGKLEHLIVNHIGVVSGCICVLLGWDEPRKEVVRKIRALNVPLLVFVVTESGQKKKLDPGPMREQPDCFYVLEAGKIQQGLARL